MRIIPPSAPDRAMPLPASRWTFGIASLDTALGGGMALGRIHEIYAAEPDDATAAAGFAAAVAAGIAAGGADERPDGGAGMGRTVLWLRAQRAIRLGGMMQANGWAELGGGPAHGLLGVVPDSVALLRAAVDALRCAALRAVIVEGWGAMRELDLTASRRLALAAERSGVPLLLLRHDAAPVPSAAQTRWQVAAAPSRALPGNAPGLPTFDLTLLRQRSGPSGLAWRLEWNRDRYQFTQAPLSGAVVSVPVLGPSADRATGSCHANERHAA